MFNPKQLLSLAFASLIVGMLGVAAVSAATPGEGESFEDRQAFQELVDREVTQLDNGVQILITTDDAEALEKVQSHEGPEREGVDASRELLDNGVLVTITSDDSEQVERIQAHAERGPRGRRGGHRGCNGGGEEPPPAE